MKIKFDNLDDVRAKLLGTFCYYQNKAVYIKAIDQVPNEANEYVMACYPVGGGASERQNIRLSNKDFRCSDFHIGYANFAHASVYYYRTPARQYRQGLKAEQVRTNMSNPAFRHEIQFSSNKSVRDMMENNYPTIQDARKRISDGLTEVLAFHKDFAITRNRIHNDFILEYKGTKVGHTVGEDEYNLMPEHQHLAEALKEAIG